MRSTIALPLGVAGLCCSLALAPGRDVWELEEPAPAVPLHPARLEAAAGVACAECHADVVAEWAASAHGIAWVDTVYQESLRERKRPQLCHACHIPEPLLAGGELAKRPKARAAELQAHELGISCETCHLGPAGEQLGATGVGTDAHATARSEHLALPGSNDLCSACHANNIGPVIGLAKDFRASKQAERGRSCVGCHMAIVERAPAAGGATTEASSITGRSHLLQTPRDPAFLRRAVELAASVEGGRATLRIANRAGHRVPGLIGRELRITAELLDGDEVVERGELTITAREYLPVDSELSIAFGRAGTAVRVVGDHKDPRQDATVRFLEERVDVTP